MPTKKIQIIGSLASDVSWADVKDKPTLIKSGSQTIASTESGGENVYTFTNTDGETSTFIVKNGSNGYSPVRGTDYWTEADKAEIKSYVDEAILGGSW